MASHLTFQEREILVRMKRSGKTIADCEVQEFPVFSLAGTLSSHVVPVTQRLQKSGLTVTIERVPLRICPGGQ